MEFVIENEQQGEQYETIYTDDHSENAASIEVNNDYQQQGEQWETYYVNNATVAVGESNNYIPPRSNPRI